MKYFVEETETLEAARAQLQLEHPNGGFVVIYEDKILGVWKDKNEALRAGYDKFGNVQYLVRDLDESKRILYWSGVTSF
jgi:hypothetical protein